MALRKQLAHFIAITLVSLSMGLTAVSSYARNVLPEREGFKNETPHELKDVDITEHLGDQVNLDLKFKNENGELVPLRSFFKDQKPVLLSLAYYNCPSLCNFHLNGLNDTFKELKSPLGDEFNFVVVSIDPRETPDLASKKKAAYLDAYGRPEGNAGWNFLVGDEAEIHELAKQVGFSYRWDEEQQQWAHAAAAFVLTPDGKISRYLYGITFSPQTLRLSLVEASNGKIGSLVDKLILFCFHFDPKASKYTLYAFNVVRAGGVMTIIILGMFIAPFWLRNRREEKQVQGEA